MNLDTLDFSISNNVATITLSRPENANALDPKMAKELSDVAIECDENKDVRAVIIEGKGKMFCAGGDLKTFSDAGNSAPALIKQMAGDLHIAISRFSRMDAPTIAAINGTAAGAGFSIAISADLVISAKSAKFVMAYTNAGLSPDGSSTYFLPRRIGDRRARELMLTNRLLSAEEALEWGLINKIVEENDLSETARELARTFARGPTLAFGKVKSLLNSSFDNGLETQMELETRGISDMARSLDGQEGIEAFLNKRKPKFRGE